MNGPAQDDLHAGIAAQQSAEGAQIVTWIGMNDGQQGLRGQAEFVGYGDADAPRTVIEAEDSRDRRRYDLRGRGRLHECDGTRNARWSGLEVARTAYNTIDRLF